jgi:FMN phosphatase YigB (HAD superfamily)
MTIAARPDAGAPPAPPRDVRLGGAWEAIRSPATAVVTTDVFDTLVWRTVPEPVDAFPLVAERLAAAGRLAADLEPDAFGRLRAQAEIKARGLRHHLGHAEVALEEIYALIPGWVFAWTSPAEAAATELEVEQELVVPDLDVVALLEAAQGLGKRVVAVSDTYFSAAQLRSLLAQPGLGRLRFDAVFTSSDHRVNKSGGLFEAALSGLGAEPAAVVHLGDNHEADVEIPGKLGIRCFHFERRPAAYARVADAERRFRRAAGSAREAVVASGLTGARSKVLSRPERAELPPGLRPFWDYGACVLGPVFTGFAEWIVTLATSGRTPKPLCLMREGTFLAELVRRAAASLGEDVDPVPFWVNRSILLRAAISEVSRGELDRLMSRRSPPTVEDLCRSLGVSIAEMPQYVSHAGTTLDDPILRQNIVGHLADTPDLRARILDGAHALRERIVAYTEREAGAGDEPLMVVDRGWGATIQAELARVLTLAGRPRWIRGAYLLTNVRAAPHVLAGTDFQGIEARGFLGEFGVPEGEIDVIMRSPELLEQICMPAHGSQLDLDQDLRPVLGENHLPVLQQVEADAVRKGIFTFQREWGRYRVALGPRLPALTEGRDQLRTVLLRSVAAPTPDEAGHFGRWHHDEGQGSGKTDLVSDPADVPRLRYMTPDQARRLPMTDVYWPFGLAGLVDEHAPDLMAAAAAGQIPWEALGAPLETGRFVVEASRAVDFHDWSRHTDTPARNRLGLSMVQGSLHAAHIEEVAFRPSDRPAVIRLDWIEVRCWTQGRNEPVVARLEGDAFARLGHANCFHVKPNLYLAHGSAPLLTLDVASITRGIVFRVDYEVAFAAFASPELFPAGGRFADLDHAERELARLEQSLSWRATAPLRAAKRRLR